MKIFKEKSVTRCRREGMKEWVSEVWEGGKLKVWKYIRKARWKVKKAWKGLRREAWQGVERKGQGAGEREVWKEIYKGVEM